MTVLFNQNLPRGATNDFSNQFSDLIYTTTLAANTAQSITVPSTSATGMGASASTSNRFIAIFKVQDGKTVFVSRAGTAVVATGSVAATQSELIPNGYEMGRHVKAGDTLSLITADASAIVQVVFYFVNA